MATNLPRRLNPDTGEWEVDSQPPATTNQQPSAPTEFGAGSTTQPASGTPPPLPPPPAGQGAELTYNAPQVPGSNIYNPNADFIMGGPDYTNYAANVAASGTQTATPTATSSTTLPADLSANMTDDQVKAWTANYLRTHGGDPSKVDYWLGKWHLWGSKDPNYYIGKLSNDESIPGAQWSKDAANASSLLTPMTPPASLGTGGAVSIGASDSNNDPLGAWNTGENDPYAELGGGVRLASGLWVPKGSGLASGALWNGSRPGSTTTSTTTTTGGPVNKSYQQAIQDLLNTPNKVDPKELMDSSENQAFQLGQQRTEERNRAQIAERNAANGLSASGGQENAFAGLRQQRGEQESNFIGQLAITRMQQHREDLVNGIQFAMADSQFDKAQALTKELGLLDASIRNKQIDTQASTEGAKLTESGRQYDLGLGFQYTDLSARQRQAAMELLLNGGSFA